MTLEALYFIAQILAALAIVASLLFVGTQIKANTREHRLVSLNMRSEKWVALNADITKDPALRDILLRGNVSRNDLSPNDAMAFDAFWVRYASYIIDVATQRALGIIDEGVWENYKYSMQVWCIHPGVREWWRIEGAAQYAPYPRAILEEFFGSTSSDGAGDGQKDGPDA